jgi:hypothetical protein
MVGVMSVVGVVVVVGFWIAASYDRWWAGLEFVEKNGLVNVSRKEKNSENILEVR